MQDDSKVKDLEKEVKALKKQIREAPKPSTSSGDERVRDCVWNQSSGAPRHRRDVVPVAASARWRGVSRPYNRTHWLISTQVRELEQELEWAREDRGGEAELLREELAEAKKKAHAAQTQRAAEVERLEERCRALEQQNSQQGQSLVSLRGDVAKITDSERAKRDDLEREISRLTEAASKLQKKCDDTEKRREDVAAELSEALASGGGGGGGGERCGNQAVCRVHAIEQVS